MNELLALTALGTPWLAALVAGSGGAARAAAAARVSAWITGVGALGAALLAIGIGIAGPQALTAAGPLALRLDGLAAIMLVLVLGLSAIIQSFALRYLRGDRRQTWFVASANLLTATTALMVSADALVLFAAAWLASGLALVLMLATYAPEAQAALGVRATLGRLALGDSAFVIAIAALIATLGWGATFADLGQAVSAWPPVAVAAVAILLVLPALARSSQLPFHGWLPLTLAAPTPASALMHAGVVNAGAILIIRFTPVVGASALAMQLLFVAGSATLVLAALLRMTKADVKGRLVYSTMAQMGFMIMTCSIGAAAAAVFHLVAHGLYKSALFLSAGSAIQQATRERLWPAAAAPTSRAATAVALAAAVTLAILTVFGVRLLVWPDISGPSLAPLLFVVLAAAVALAGALGSRLTWGTALGGALIVAVLALAYTLGLRLFAGLLGDPATPPGAVSPWWVLLPGLLLLATQALTRLPDAAPRLRDAIYARSLAAAAPTLTPRPATPLASPLATQRGN